LTEEPDNAFVLDHHVVYHCFRYHSSTRVCLLNQKLDRVLESWTFYSYSSNL